MNVKKMNHSNIKYCIKFFLVAVNIFVTNNLTGQFYSMGNDPGRVKWRYSESQYFRIIYPEEIDSTARRYAWLLESLREPVHHTLKVKTSKIDVVLHPFSAQSNGMVGWAPSRIELITMAPANDHYVHNWDKHLVIHELRHVAQVSKFKQGVFKPAGWLIGEQAAAIGTGLFMSQWTMEGDAIISETELTSGGRGRDPDHLLFYRTAFLSGDHRNHDRWTMGSYKEYVPDPYSYGYLFNSFVRFNTGNKYYLAEVTEHVVNRFYNPFSQRNAYRKLTGFSKKGNFEKLAEFYTAKWQKEDSARAPFTQLVRLESKSVKGYTNYTSPVITGNHLFCLKQDLDNIPSIIKIFPDGTEVTERVMGRVNSPLKAREGKIYWTEYITSPRWELESFSDLFCYDVNTGKSERLTVKERLFNPTLSPSGDSLLVVSYGIKGESKLRIYDAAGITILDEFPAPPGYRLKEGVVATNSIIATAVKDSGISIFILPLDGNPGWQLLADAKGKIISNLEYNPTTGELMFVSDIEGVKGLFALDINEKTIVSVVRPRFGIEGYCLGREGAVIVSDFTANGYELKEARATAGKNIPGSNGRDSYEFGEAYRDTIVNSLVAQAAYNTDTLETPAGYKFESKPYRKGANLFRIHSWAPVYYNIDNIKNLTYESVYDLVSPGFILYSQNSLSTAYAMAGYSWQRGFHSGHFKFRYHGFFPVIEVSGDLNTRDRTEISLTTNNQGNKFQINDTIFGSPYFKVNMLAYVPLRFNSGGWSSGVVPRFSWRYTNDRFYSDRNVKFGNYQFASFGVSLYRVRNMAHRDIFPKKGGGMSILYSVVPFSGENFGSLLYSSLYLYTPGMVAGHGIKLSAAFQQQFYNKKNYLMSNTIAFPSGYEERYSKWAFSASAEYAMPLYTADIPLTPLLYIRRVQLKPFATFFRNGGQSGPENLWAVGSDLLFDLNLLGISYPLVLGIRGGVNGEKRTFAELLFKTPL